MFTLTKFCFICLKAKKKLINLNSQQYDINKEKIKYALPEIWESTLDVPIYICVTCQKPFITFYNFKKMCLKSYNRFNEFIILLNGRERGVKQRFKNLQINFGLNNFLNSKPVQLKPSTDFNIKQEIQDILFDDSDDEDIEDWFAKEMETEDSLPSIKPKDEWKDSMISSIKSEVYLLLLEAEKQEVIEDPELLPEKTDDGQHFEEEIKSENLEGIEDLLSEKIEIVDHLLPEKIEEELTLPKEEPEKMEETLQLFEKEVQSTEEIEEPEKMEETLQLFEKEVQSTEEIEEPEKMEESLQLFEKGEKNIEYQVQSTEETELEETLSPEPEKNEQEKKIEPLQPVEIQEGEIEDQIQSEEKAKEIVGPLPLLHQEQQINKDKIIIKLVSQKVKVQEDNSTKKPVALRIENFQCLTCNKKFPSNADLQNHLKADHIFNPFTCTICNKKFQYKKSFDTHVKRHSGTYKCADCTKVFHNISSLRNHIDKCHKYECTKCKEIFSHKVYLEMHMYTSHELLVCSKCDQIFANFSEFKQHTDTSHVFIPTPEPAWFECSVCKLKFTDKSFLEIHTNLYHLKFECSKCKKRFANASLLKEHMIIHLNFKCTLCSQAFDNYLDLEQHKKEHIGCSMCEQIFVDKSILKRHINDVHLKFECSKCKKRFANASLLKDHMIIHSDYQCITCDLIFANYSDLEQHFALSHFGCLTCTRKFANQAIFVRHMNVVHFKFECSKCKKRFLTTTLLQEHMHMNSHFACKLCNRNFTNYPDLEKHLKTPHMEETLFLNIYLSCTICKEKFLDIQVLKNHMNNVHLKFECTKCKKRFLNETLLQQHMQLENACSTEVKLNDIQSIPTQNSTENTVSKLRNTPLKFDCSVCKISFGNVILLQKHMEVHSNLECTLCNQKFTEYQYLKMHLKNTHSEEMKHFYYECNLCQKQLKDEPRLQCHILTYHFDIAGFVYLMCQERVSDNSTQYYCTICFKHIKGSYNFQNHLDLHYRTTNFHCLLCNTQYTTKRLLQSHVLNTHLKSNQFKCKECFLSFQTCFLYEQHMDNAHSGIHKCNVCYNKFASKYLLEQHDCKIQFKCNSCDKSFDSRYLLDKHTHRFHLATQLELFNL